MREKSRGAGMNGMRDGEVPLWERPASEDEGFDDMRVPRWADFVAARTRALDGVRYATGIRLGERDEGESPAAPR
jgi:hypothetical protein